MSEGSVDRHKPRLRRDLHSMVVDGRRRAYRIVVDEVSGQFTRVSERLWQSLSAGEGDETLWQDARAAGWTCDRLSAPQRQFSPLYFRIPIGSVDRVASWLAPLSGTLFSVAASLFWSSMILLACVLAASRSAELMASLGSLQQFLGQSNPVWLGALFIGTKIAHELAHAVMCRRMGARCGNVGVLMLCGMPCPYCDVTDIWRLPSAARRAAVMFAGIYVELIIAAVATFVWVCATEPAVRLHALNLMVVCGVSTLVFNANPLMRYDGYYILGDMIDSPNLRQEARGSFGEVILARIAGSSYGRSSRDLRSIWLAFYHAASVVYRCVVAIAIATLFLGLADFVNLRSLGVVLVILAATAMAARSCRRLVGVAVGRHRWQNVPVWRRGAFSLMLVLLVLGALFVPLPRYRSASGNVDAVGATSVFLPDGGIVDQVHRDVGEFVRAGDAMLQLRNEKLAIRQASLRGQLRVATLRGTLSRRVALNRAETAEHWRTLQAAEEAVAAQLASIEQRVRATAVPAPINGVVLPAESVTGSDQGPSSQSLRDRRGGVVEAGGAWCRISPDGKLFAVLAIDARDRTHIDVGTPVRINLRRSPELVFTSKVASVSAIETDEPSVTRQAAFEVLCPLTEVDQRDLLPWLGATCTGVFHLPKRALVSDLSRWTREWLGGQ